jgi:hypothetical protein
MKRFLLGASLVAVQTSGAQNVVADSLLQRGSLERAESVYYAAARVRPHDPLARWGLGRYLAGRGASKVAVTLLEEALRFGGDSALIGADLAPLYLTLWDYHSLIALPARLVVAGDRERARYLESHPTRLVAPDSVMTILYRDANDAGYLGRLPIRVNGRIVEALIAPGMTGLMLSDSTATAARVRRFTARAAQRGGAAVIPAAVDSIGIGRLAFVNFPVTVTTTGGPPATIGLDVIGKLAPTFDARAERMTVRISGSVQPPVPGDRFSTWSTPSELRVLQAGGWLSIVNPQLASMLRQRRWTLDAKRGAIILER